MNDNDVRQRLISNARQFHFNFEKISQFYIVPHPLAFGDWSKTDQPISEVPQQIASVQLNKNNNRREVLGKFRALVFNFKGH